jgi:hypothetical protein
VNWWGVKSLLLTLEFTADNIGRIVVGPINRKSKDLFERPKKNNVFTSNYDASNPVEASGIVGKNFPFELRIEALHRLEPANRVELA